MDDAEEGSFAPNPPFLQLARRFGQSAVFLTPQESLRLLYCKNAHIFSEGVLSCASVAFVTHVVHSQKEGGGVPMLPFERAKLPTR